MGDGGEELHAGIAHLLFLGSVQLFDFLAVATLGHEQAEADEQGDERDDEHHIEHLGIDVPPEGRVNLNLQRGHLVRPHTVVVGGLHAEGVVARRQVGVGGFVVVAHVGPVLVEALEHIGIDVLLGRAIAERGKRQAERLVVIPQVELLGHGEGLRQMPVAHGDGVVVDFQFGDEHGCRLLVDLDFVGIERVEAVDGAEVDAPVAGSQHGVGLKLLAVQSVLSGESLHALVGCIAQDASVGGEPERALVLGDGSDGQSGQVERHPCEVVALCVVAAQSALRAGPYGAFPVDENAVYEVGAQRLLVVDVVVIGLHLAAALRVVAPHATALRGHPEAPAVVLLDVDGYRLHPHHLFEVLFLPVVAAQSLHRGHPDVALPVAQQGTRVGVEERVGSIGGLQVLQLAVQR